MRLFLLTLFLVTFFLSPIFSQKVLQMEKAGKVTTKKYFIGDELIFQLAGQDHWHRENIQDIYVDDNLVLFTNRVVKVEDIIGIKSFKNRSWSKALALNAYVASGAFIILSLLTKALGLWELTRATAIIPGVTVAAGWLVQKVFKSKKYKIGKKRRLRVLDITFYRSHP